MQLSQFTELANLEPGLLTLKNQISAYAQEHRAKKNFRPRSAWYGYGTPSKKGFKHSLSCFVGYSAANAALQNERAYDIAYNHLYGLLAN